MNKKGQSGLGIIGFIFLMVVGILILSVSSSDTSKIVFWLGIIFLASGIIGLISLFSANSPKK